MMADIPLEKIQEMKDKGMSNTQVLESLQDQGYSTSQIYDSLRPEANAPPPPGAVSPGPVPPPHPSQPPLPSADTEELVEAIIDEKWNDLMADINKVIEWKDSSEERIVKMEQQLADMKDQLDQLHKAIIGKVTEYDQHILDVGAEVKAMEKVFSKVLPAFTDNVAELSRITSKLKMPKKK